MVMDIFINEDGGFDLESTPNGMDLVMIGTPDVINAKQKEQSIMITILTGRGELLFYPEFGVDFEALDEQLRGYSNIKSSQEALIRLNIQQALSEDSDLQKYFDEFRIDNLGYRQSKIVFKISTVDEIDPEIIEFNQTITYD